MNGVKNHPFRYLGVVAVFCLICVIYLGRLFYIQIAGRESAYENDTTTRRVTVQAVRGEIYDRNGNKLVENRYTYDLTLSHGRFSSLVAAQKNEVLLSLLESLEACGAESLHTERFFAMDGQYPYYSYSADAQNSDTAINYRLLRVLSRLGLKEDASADELMRYYVDTYRLIDCDKDGNRLYDDDEVHALIRLYYDMDALDFRGNGEYVFAKGLALDGDGVNLMTHVKEKSLAAVNFRGEVERVYLYAGYASHILGSVGPIYAEEWDYYDEQGYPMNAIVGKNGCESAFENYLHGIDGEMEIEEDANGNLISVKTLSEPVAGNDVHLTIDIDLQIAAEDGLRENVQYVSERTEDAQEGALCDAGAAVAIDPNTFEVLAIASYPTFDLMTFNEDYATLTEDPAEPLRNRALNEAYAPGSTLKPGMAAIALQEGVLNASENIPCTGKYRGAVGCSTFGQNHWGALDVFDAITHSCNSFFCELGDRLGIRKMESYLGRFGLGRSTGLELGGTKGTLAGPTYRGEIQSEESWEVGMTWQAAIGQSDHKMSPLQLACYAATIANGGTRYAAHLLHSVYAFGSEEPIKESEVAVLDEVGVSQEAIADVRQAMRQMASSDTGGVKRYFTSLPDAVTVGGKTGTAQVGADNPDNALFICEATDDPAGSDIAISVVLEQGAHGYHAARTAGAILEAFYGVEN